MSEIKNYYYYYYYIIIIICVYSSLCGPGVKSLKLTNQ